jgi:hypothetical protein
MRDESENAATVKQEPNKPGLGCRILVFIPFAIVAALGVFAAVFIVRLANSPIGSGRGVGIAVIAMIIAIIALVVGLGGLFSAKKK